MVDYGISTASVPVRLTELNLSITYTVKELTRGKQHPTTQIPANMPDFPLFVR